MKTFKYNLTVPTSAPNIGLAIGPFDIHVDRAMPEMTHFCLHGLQKELKTTTAMTYQARDKRTDNDLARKKNTVWTRVANPSKNL